MQAQRTFLCMLALGAASASKLEVTPVQKVVQLLTGMAEKGKKEKHDEQVLFAEEKQWCDDTQVMKKRSIEESTQTIETLAAKIGKAGAQATLLTKQIGGLDEDVSVWTGDKKAATSVRTIEKADYDALHNDYSESIDALTRAIAVMKKQTHDRGQAASLTQVSTLKSLALIPESAKKAIDLFLQEEVSEEATSAPEANGYENQSSGVIQMLEKLQSKFVDERTTVEKEEANSKHAYNMLMQDLAAQISQANKDSSEKSERKAAALQSKATKSGDKKDEEGNLAADSKYLKDITATCAQKASDFESRQQLRADEIVAIEKAIEIMSSSSVAGKANKHLPSLAQKQAVSLGQLRSNANTQNQDRVVKFLKARAAKLNSRVLESIADKAAADPFAKVKKMIKDMVLRLMEEANEESEHKGWCDTELATNEQTRKEKTNGVETLHAEIDELSASISKLTEGIGDLSNAVAELDSAMSQATKLRQAEKAKNTDTVADAQEAQTAVAQALTVLREFYAKAGEATAFVQGPYNGMQSQNGGVTGMLEVIASDFARLESDTKASEASAQHEFDQFMTDSKTDKAAKATDVEHKTAKKQDQSQAFTQKSNDLEGTQKELDSSLAYFDKLKPSCVDSGVSYEDRVARRKEEVESLQESLKVLNGEDIA